jgi:hypothetical protein
MTSQRPYHEPIPVAQARIELQRCADSQDLQVVRSFLQFPDEQLRNVPYPSTRKYQRKMSWPFTRQRESHANFFAHPCWYSTPEVMGHGACMPETWRIGDIVIIVLLEFSR